MASLNELKTGSGVIAITPADSNLAKNVRALYIGGGGDVAIVASDGTEATFSAFPAGKYLLTECKQVKATGTTATNIIGIY
jgi:hypothetical protein